MQQELDATTTDREIRIIGVNAEGREAGNDLTCAGRDLPWLQDSTTENVWTVWDVGYRDVFIVDQENRLVDVYNLTTYDLANPESYETLKGLLVAAADAG